MFTPIASIEDKLAEFIQKYADDRCCLLELLRFFGKHPYTRFSRCAVIHALKNQGVSAERGLKYLVDRCLITTETENNTQLYSLTKDEPLRSWALDLLKLDWFHWQLLLRRFGSAD